MGTHLLLLSEVPDVIGVTHQHCLLAGHLLHQSEPVADLPGRGKKKHYKGAYIGAYKKFKKLRS